MYCSNCGKNIGEGAKYCIYCGEPTGLNRDDNMTVLTARARNGNQNAIAALYEKTYDQVFYTIKSMIKDEDAVFDILQDSYIKAFSHLDSFQGDAKFLPWIRQIAANTARDWLKKKRPLLFTELNTEETSDISIEEQFEDKRTEAIPEQLIDQKETIRLVREIIDDLSEDQRAVIGMYYYEELSVKEIAAAIGATESAIKSRLMYGRKKIENKIRELEKQGTKLYGLAPIPFLLLLFRSRDAYAAERSSQPVLQNILENVGNSGAASAGIASAGKTASAVSRTAAALGGIGTAKAALIGLAAVAVIGAGIGGILHHNQSSRKNDSVPALPAVSSSAPVMPSSDTSAVKATPSSVPAVPSPVDEALAQYRIIIGQASSYQYDLYGDTPTGRYRYALVQMQPTTNSVPTLLLSQEIETFYYTRVFQYDSITKTVHQPEESLMDGVALTGGYRSTLGLQGDGNGLMFTEWSSGTGEAHMSRVILNGDSLKTVEQWEGRIDMIPDELDERAIPWHELSDLSALEEWAPGAANLSPEDLSDSSPTGSVALLPAGSASPQMPAATPHTEAAVPVDGDRIVLSGTFGVYSYDEVVALQGQPDPNAGPWTDKSRTYVLIVLDTPQTLELITASNDGFLSREAKMIDISYAEGMEQYDGQHLFFSIDPSKTSWPSDASLPLGQPATSDIHILQ